MEFRQIKDITLLTKICSIYDAAKKEEGCPWNDQYPDWDLLASDINEGCMYGLFDMGRIAGLIVRDRDASIDALPVWNQKLKPAAELARLVVTPEYQNQGVARRLIEEMCAELRKKGFKSVHYLVEDYNIRAVRSYAKLEFNKVGNLNLFGSQYSCYEKDLTAVEEWDAYDEEFNKIPGVTLVRGEVIPLYMMHMVVEIVVRHKDGTYLCVQRDHSKNKGGLWEISAGGSALKGENPFAAAKRELFEETGIKGENLLQVGRKVNRTKDTFFVEFLCITDCPKESIVLQKGETIAYEWLTPEEIKATGIDSFATTRTFEYVK